MSKMKKVLLMGTAYVLVAALAIGGTIAYLTDTDSDVNVMTMGNVSIRQNEQQRVEKDGQFTNELEDFEQGKILMPVTYPGDRTADTVTIGGYDLTFSDKEANYVDKIVSVTNTGKSDAYVRTLVAVPTGGDDWEPTPVSANNCWLHWNMLQGYDTHWTLSAKPNFIEIDGKGYYVWEFVHKAALQSGKTTFPVIRGFYMDQKVDHDDNGFYMTYADGTTKRIEDVAVGDSLNVLVLTQAVQAAGFDSAATALDTGFGDVTDAKDAEWFSGLEAPVLGTQVDVDNVASIDFTAENTKFVFNGTFADVNISELGAGSEIYLNNATIGDLTLGSDASITGTGNLNNIETTRNGAEAVTLNITGATLDVTGNINVKNTDNKSVLNVTDSNVTCGWIFVGEHTNNHQAALAEFNVINSVVSADEKLEPHLGSTISVWGKSGVSAKIYDSEIYTYSKGWHNSDDANDNSITFQGDEFINVDIQRSNMHLYGARSIVNARPYNDYDGNCEVNFTIDESLIWVVTKSNHGEETLPVWGATDITDSMLLFTKNRSTDPIFKSFVYGNPVIHGDYHITTQCAWDADIVLADGQTVTFASDANVSIYDGAGDVQFVKNGSAKVVLEDGAVVKNIGGLN